MFDRPIRYADALLTPARLMSPTQVRAAMMECGEGAPALDGWFLCGDVSAPMFAAMTETRGACGVSVAALTHARAGNYVVLTQQLGIFQHRFVLPLFEAPVFEFLASLRAEPLQVAMGDAGEAMAAVSRARISWHSVEPVVGLLQVASEIDIGEALSGIPDVVAKICEFASIAPVPGQPGVRDLSVSVLVPPSLLELAEREAYGDRALH